MPMSTSSTWLTRHTSHEYPYGQRMLELEFKWERGSKLESPEIDTRLGTQSIIHYEIVSVDLYDIFPTTKNPNEVTIKLWENNKQPPWDKSVHEKEERELKQLSRHRKIPGFLIQNARAGHRIKISERGKDACNSFVRCSIGIILVAIRSILRFRQSISQPHRKYKNPMHLRNRMERV